MEKLDFDRIKKQEGFGKSYALLPEKRKIVKNISICSGASPGSDNCGEVFFGLRKGNGVIWIALEEYARIKSG